MAYLPHHLFKIKRGNTFTSTFFFSVSFVVCDVMLLIILSFVTNDFLYFLSLSLTFIHCLFLHLFSPLLSSSHLFFLFFLESYTFFHLLCYYLFLSILVILPSTLFSFSLPFTHYYFHMFLASLPSFLPSKLHSSPLISLYSDLFLPFSISLTVLDSPYECKVFPSLSFPSL